MYPGPRFKCGLANVNSQPGSAQVLGPPPKPMDPHCLVPRPRAASGRRHVPQGRAAGAPRISGEWCPAARGGFGPRQLCGPAALNFPVSGADALNPGSRPGAGLQGRNAGLERSQCWVWRGGCLRETPRENEVCEDGEGVLETAERARAGAGRGPLWCRTGCWLLRSPRPAPVEGKGQVVVI